MHSASAVKKVLHRIYLSNMFTGITRGRQCLDVCLKINKGSGKMQREHYKCSHRWWVDRNMSWQESTNSQCSLKASNHRTYSRVVQMHDCDQYKYKSWTRNKDCNLPLRHHEFFQYHRWSHLNNRYQYHDRWQRKWHQIREMEDVVGVDQMMGEQAWNRVSLIRGSHTWLLIWSRRMPGR